MMHSERRLTLVFEYCDQVNCNEYKKLYILGITISKLVKTWLQINVSCG